MPKNIDEIITELPIERRQYVEERAEQLIEEYMTLQNIRKARALTQKSMAQALGIGQDSVSRLEKRKIYTFRL